ncbi:putative cell survival pathways protein [Paraconiothyrium brasiliense]|uniref:Cell survival pathways protein n=1 Tax=Paraconiothyrium brasiliense TaxID=300254 RepID=A0ABR3QWZ3_9PLEO
MQEPEYGPEAIHPVGKNAGDPAYTELKKEHLKWKLVEQTCVETQTFYLQADSGHYCFMQVIYNNIAYVLHVTPPRIAADFDNQRFAHHDPVQRQDLVPG